MARPSRCQVFATVSATCRSLPATLTPPIAGGADDTVAAAAGAIGAGAGAGMAALGGALAGTEAAAGAAATGASAVAPETEPASSLPVRCAAYVADRSVP